MFGLICLPYEVLANIVSHVDFDDVFSMGLTCKALNYFLTEESICKVIVQSKIRYSNEARQAERYGGGNSSALRRAVKRREALATANPYIVATVGFGDAYLYSKGVLCYTLDDRVRVLDLHNSAKHEVVISIPHLLRQCLAEIEDHPKGVFQVLYYSDKIISCIYKSSGQDSTAWLIAFSIRNRNILAVQELESTDKIFVRHNHRFLYYGTHSEIGVDGYKKWVIHGVEFQKKKWFDYKVHLPDMVGSEIGSTICFEFHNNYFYALSNQTSFEVEEIDWTSFYHCIRFPLNSPCKELLEKTENHSMWRRQHQEGPIDDRWTSLRLDEDESTGELKIVESRKEWALGSSRSQRTHYTTKIVFPNRTEEEDLDFDYVPAAPFSLSSGSFNGSTFNSGTATTSGSSSTSMASGSSNLASNASNLSSTLPTPASVKHHQDLSTLPNDPILKLLRPDDNPHHMAAPPRLASQTHPGNDGSSKPSITLSKCRIRHYHTSCNTFIDLVDDPCPTDWQGTQRLRLRCGSRRLGPLLSYPLTHPSKAGLRRPPSDDLHVALAEMYREGPICFWPPAQDPLHPNAQVDVLYRMLNPPTHLGNVEGTADERSMVYVTGGEGGPKAIVFIGFDPGMKLVGLKRWGGLGQKGVGEGPHIDGRATGCSGKEGELGKGKEYIDVGEADRTVVMERKGKGRELCTPAVQFVGGEAVVDFKTGVGRENTGGVKRNCWAWREKAMYRDIGLGFYFGLEKNMA